MTQYPILSGLKQFLEQSQRAERAMRIHHDKLVAAGFTWDGQDGYVAPPGFTEEDASRLWLESLEEAKNVQS